MKQSMKLNIISAIMVIIACPIVVGLAVDHFPGEHTFMEGFWFGLVCETIVCWFMLAFYIKNKADKHEEREKKRNE